MNPTSQSSRMVAGFVTWTSDQTSYAGEIYQQRYDQNGEAVGPQVRVPVTSRTFQGYPVVAGLEDGGWIVAWQSLHQDGSGSGIYQQRFDSTGQKIGEETIVNQETLNNQQVPNVTALANGGWVVTWVSDHPFDGYGLYQRVYAPNGEPATDELLIASLMAPNSVTPQAVAFDDGSWMVVWNDGPLFSKDVYQQRFAFNVAPEIGNVPVEPQNVFDNAEISPFAGMTFSDGEDMSAQITVTISFEATHGALENLLNGGTYSAGAYTITGTAIQVQEAVNALVFNPADRPTDATGTVQETIFSITATDQYNTVDQASLIVRSTSAKRQRISVWQATRRLHRSSKDRPK